MIVAGYDRTDGSSHALAYAAGLAERTGARLVVVSAAASGMALGCPPVERDCADTIAAEVREVIGVPACTCAVIVENGDPRAVIRRAAEDVQADIVVVGRPRHPRWHLFGSVPAQLHREATHPVLVVP